LGEGESGRTASRVGRYFREAGGGHDGVVWVFLKNVLVRIHPKDASVHVVGRIDPPGKPPFAGNDIYFTGTRHLRRIRNIVPTP